MYIVKLCTGNLQVNMEQLNFKGETCHCSRRPEIPPGLRMEKLDGDAPYKSCSARVISFIGAIKTIKNIDSGAIESF
jgi:hypothetical protein